MKNLITLDFRKELVFFSGVGYFDLTQFKNTQGNPLQQLRLNTLFIVSITKISEIIIHNRIYKTSCPNEETNIQLPRYAFIIPNHCGKQNTVK